MTWVEMWLAVAQINALLETKIIALEKMFQFEFVHC